MARKQRYPGKDVTVTYDPDVCTHAAECVRGLPAVFDTSRRRWIDPDAAEAAIVIEVVGRCPTGALQIEGIEAAEAANEGESVMSEPENEPNKVQISANGPAIVSGQVKVVTADGEVVEEATRVALCRCGESQNKPYCAGSHNSCGFEDPGLLSAVEGEDIELEGEVTAVLATNGPVILRGAAEWSGADGSTARFSKRSLCRCGESNNKPFCDGSHKECGFDSGGR